jgi:spermidine synthase
MKVLLSSVVLVLLGAVKASPNEEVDNQKKWLRSKGGFFSDKVVYGSLDENGALINGMFAVSPIKKNERIFVLPNKVLLTAGPSQDVCDTARNLAREYHLKSASDYAPYVEYVYGSFSHEDHPLAWSRDAKDLMATLVGKELEPQHFGQESFERSCGNTEEDENTIEILKAAWRIVVARSWGDKLIPVLDLLNHRNGRFHNVDQANSAHEGKDIVVVALRDINEGEQLYNSYNECPDIDCEGIALTYGAPQMLNDYGFVEQYPRRFNFETNKGFLVFDVDIQEDNTIKVIWLSQEPDVAQISFLKGHLDRLHKLNSTISLGVEQLQSHEKNTIMQYYQALIQALDLSTSSWQVSRQRHSEECKILSNGDNICSAVSEYDILEDTHDPLEYHSYVCDLEVRDHPKGRVVFEEESKSHYQLIEYKYFYDFESEDMDKCLFLDGWIHSCSSYRPHYHEWLVHYPASFLRNVKRVLFMGAGDSMILHEFLKYPEVELVVGLELDQEVVRTSFKHFDTQPHFDDDRVDWWFGDAAKSLQMMPKDYYGSFDLIVIDLLSYVVESLMVTQDLSVLEYAMLLLKPDGVVSYNEDFVSRREVDYAEYMVDLNFLDVPVLCQTHVNMGSNGVDFLFADQFDHGVDTMVVTQAKGRKFDAWWNYRKASHRTSKFNKNDGSPSSIELDISSRGVMIILEVEDSTRLQHSTNIAQALKKVGLTVLSSNSPQSNVLFMALQEGYVVLRSWPEFKYHAFDIMLWNNFDLLHLIQDELIASVGGKSSSSFRIVTSGIGNDHVLNVPLNENKSSTPIQDNESMVPPKLQVFNTFVEEIFVSAHQSVDPVIVVFCPSQGSPCKGLEAFKNKNGIKGPRVVPVWSCISEENSQSNLACDATTHEIMRLTASHAKINGIVLDPNVPKRMGQILYKILSDNQIRNRLLAKNYIVLAPITDSSKSWGKALLERFRTNLTTFSPAYHAEIVFGDRSETSQVNVFSSGNYEFHANLVDVIKKCENSTGLAIEVKSVRDGFLNYITDFEATKTATDADYDNISAREQWDSQHPVGMQTMFQYEVQPPLMSLSPGARVLRNHNNHVFVGTWNLATVKSMKDDGTYDVIDDNGLDISGIIRSSLRELDASSQAGPMTGHVLIREGNIWRQGKILEQLPDATYKVHIFDNFGSQTIVRQSELIRQSPETRDKDPGPTISSPLLEKILFEATETFLNVNINVVPEYGDDGCMITAFWSKGSAILTWDVHSEISLNLFTHEEDSAMHKSFGSAFTEKIPYLALVSHNQQPRGFGRVMNFKRDMQ